MIDRVNICALAKNSEITGNTKGLVSEVAEAVCEFVRLAS